jgi:creatinine amidohydrolase/Fe(II)-dependent formamide hydrolase-like protein
MPELAHLTWPEAKDAVAAARLALVPVGSCEQHGPHLTLDTDSAIAKAFARRLAADLAGLAVLCPQLGYGLSEHHLAFPGTLTLETSVAMVLAPASLRADRIAEPTPVGHVDALTDPPGARVDRPASFEEWTANGALGDPRRASEEIGAAVVGTAYERALAFARRLADEPLPEQEE